MVVTVFLCVQRKCEEYWPDKIHEEKSYGYSIGVTLTSITPYADFEKKVFRITKVKCAFVYPLVYFVCVCVCI